MTRLIYCAVCIAGMAVYYLACKWAVTAGAVAFGLPATLLGVLVFGIVCYLIACVIERNDQRSSG